MKYCPEIVAKICQFLEAGGTQEGACGYADIDEATFYRWKEKSEFCESVKKAKLKNRANDELMLAQLVKAGDRTSLFFRLKTVHGYREHSHQVVDHRGEIGLTIKERKTENDKMWEALGEDEKQARITARLGGNGNGGRNGGGRKAAKGGLRSLNR